MPKKNQADNKDTNKKAETKDVKVTGKKQTKK